MTNVLFIYYAYEQIDENNNFDIIHKKKKRHLFHDEGDE
jgi:hypothetical protein